MAVLSSFLKQIATTVFASWLLSQILCLWVMRDMSWHPHLSDQPQLTVEYEEDKTKVTSRLDEVTPAKHVT